MCRRGNVARYTWEIDALASGAQSNVAKRCSGSAPSWAAMCGRISASAAGAAPLRSWASSSHHSRGRTSLRVDATWPSLTKMPPASSRVRRTPTGSDSCERPRVPTPLRRAIDTTSL